MKFAIFGLYFVHQLIFRPFPGAWVAELLGVVLGVQDHKNIKFPKRVYSSLAANKKLRFKVILFLCSYKIKK